MNCWPTCLMLPQVGSKLIGNDGTEQDLQVSPGWPPSVDEDDEDLCAWLCKETIDAGKSVLVFCASKKVHSQNGSGLPC